MNVSLGRSAEMLENLEIATIFVLIAVTVAAIGFIIYYFIFSFGKSKLWKWIKRVVVDWNKLNIIFLYNWRFTQRYYWEYVWKILTYKEKKND